MFSMERIIGALFSAAAVRLASMALALWVGYTIVGAATTMLQDAADTVQAANVVLSK